MEEKLYTGMPKYWSCAYMGKACILITGLCIIERVGLGNHSTQVSENQEAWVKMAPSHLKADLSRAAEERLCRPEWVRVASPQVCGARCGFDSHFVWRRRLQVPVRGPPSPWGAEAGGLHRWIVKVLLINSSPLSVHSPEIKMIT